MAMARRMGYAGNPRLHGVEVPIETISSPGLLARLDSGMYEAKEVGLIRRFIPPGADVLELGASLGVVSSFILGREPRRLVSYEAVPEMASLARSVVAHNGRSGPWELVNAAVVPRESATAEFHWHPDSTDAGSLSSAQGLRRIVVPGATLGQIVARHDLKPGTWMVMDIEGAEHDIIRDSSADLGGFAGIILEAHDHGGRRAGDVFRDLESLGFVLLGRRGKVAAFGRQPGPPPSFSR